ncbi:MAG: hypothetical protein R3286_17925, partial [Gammaproteobacteria bacterium]|nr:hypothetical protein [Gammaproteobacteria bacterium]
DMVSKGLVPADEMFLALQDTSGETLSQFTGGMEQMSQTLAGQWDTLKDKASQTLTQLLEKYPQSTAAGLAQKRLERLGAQ